MFKFAPQGAGNLPSEIKTISIKEKSDIELNVNATRQLSVTISTDSSTTNRAYDYYAWSSSDTNIATVDTSGKVTAIGAGNAIITVKTLDGGKLTAQITIPVIVPVESITISASKSFPKSRIVNPGMKFKLEANISPANATDKVVTWSSDDESIAKVDASGNVIAIGEGVASIAAKTGSKAKYFVFVVAHPVTKVHTPVKTIVLKPKQKLAIPVYAYYGKSKKSANIDYELSNWNVAGIDSDTKKITALKTGTTTLTVSSYNGMSAKVTIKVVKKTGKISKVTIDAKSLPAKLKKGKSAYITCKLAPATAAFSMPKFSSSDKKVLTVDKFGKVTAKKKGTATITVKVGSKTAKKKVTVK